MGPSRTSINPDVFQPRMRNTDIEGRQMQIVALADVESRHGAGRRRGQGGRRPAASKGSFGVGKRPPLPSADASGGMMPYIFSPL